MILDIYVGLHGLPGRNRCLTVVCLQIEHVKEYFQYNFCDNVSSDLKLIGNVDTFFEATHHTTTFFEYLHFCFMLSRLCVSSRDVA